MQWPRDEYSFSLWDLSHRKEDRSGQYCSFLACGEARRGDGGGQGLGAGSCLNAKKGRREGKGGDGGGGGGQGLGAGSCLNAEKGGLTHFGLAWRKGLALTLCFTKFWA